MFNRSNYWRRHPRKKKTPWRSASLPNSKRSLNTYPNGLSSFSWRRYSSKFHRTRHHRWKRKSIIDSVHMYDAHYSNRKPNDLNRTIRNLRPSNSWRTFFIGVYPFRQALGTGSRGQAFTYEAISGGWVRGCCSNPEWGYLVRSLTNNLQGQNGGVSHRDINGCIGGSEYLHGGPSAFGGFSSTTYFFRENIPYWTSLNHPRYMWTAGSDRR